MVLCWINLLWYLFDFNIWYIYYIFFIYRFILKLFFFKDMNNFILFGGKISILFLENSMDGFYRVIILFIKYIFVDLMYYEFDICFNVVKGLL